MMGGKVNKNNLLLKWMLSDISDKDFGLFLRWALQDETAVNEYQRNMMLSNQCAEKSREFIGRDADMFMFWSNASREFEKRAREAGTLDGFIRRIVSIRRMVAIGDGHVQKRTHF